jgi:hypothetical protein
VAKVQRVWVSNGYFHPVTVALVTVCEAVVIIGLTLILTAWEFKNPFLQNIF